MTGGSPAALEAPAAKALMAGLRDWRLLWQVGNGGTVVTQYGDAGVLYLMIRDANLAVRRFERAWLVWQMH